MSKSIFITGGTRGVGLEIAKRFAREGYNVAVVGKTVTPHPKLPGTIDTAREEIIAAGANKVLAIVCDVRNLEDLEAAINRAGTEFGGLDVVVNNASALYLLSTKDITPSKFNLMHEVIVRSSLFTAKYALPYLQKSKNPHIINLAPKISLDPKWLKDYTAYTINKFSSAMMVIGMAAEFKEYNVSVNAVWPRTLLATAAVQNLLGGDKAINHSRHPRIVADAVHYLTQKSLDDSGKFYLDEELIIESGEDLAQYNVVSGSHLIDDIYVG